MIPFRILVGIDGLVAFVAVFFFLWGLSDGTVSSFNIVGWLTALGGVAAILVGGLSLNAYGQRWLANAVLLILAIPAVLYVLYFLSLAITLPRYAH